MQNEHLERWLAAWAEAVHATWPDSPQAVQRLLRVRDDVFFTAPEMIGLRVEAAWDVLREHGDTPIGRAAVALAYILAVWGGRS